MNALKTFGLGILWALLFPFIAVGMVIVGAFGAVDFVIEFVIMVANFFRGKKLFPVYREDERAYAILQKAIDKKNGESAVNATPEPQPQQVFVQQNFYSGAPIPPGSNGALPPGYMPGQLPPGYGQPNPYNQIPPQQPYGNQLPPQQPYANPLPPQQPYAGQIPPQANPYPAQPPVIDTNAEDIPPRPELARLPEFDASDFPKETRNFDIDVDEGGEDHD